MAGKQINPKLIHALTNQNLADVPLSPTFKHLKGNYVRAIVDNKRKVLPVVAKNDMMLMCKHCGKKGKYNVGVLSFDYSDTSKDLQNSTLQLSGYFRCNHCNLAGNWEESHEFYMRGIAALLVPDNDYFNVQFSKIQLFDGTTPKYCSDGEEHLLNLIAESKNSAFLWNKLGNLYTSGGRPELAMAAFEQSIEIDPTQMESHFSIGNLLIEIKDYANALHHLHQMLLTAEDYEHLEAKRLRELLSHSICSCFIMHTESRSKLPALPTKEQLTQANKVINLATEELLAGIELFSDDLTSFYPLAEAFMGKRAKEII